jgi:RNA polymerase sigma factor (sigma-70 family)
VTLMSDFARLLETEIPRLRRYARALTRDQSRADDLVQSCLCRAIAKQHLWEPGTDLRAWLFTILHNQHVNDVRRSVREGVSIPVEDIAPALTAAADPEASLQLRDLERAIACLPDEQRQVTASRPVRRSRALFSTRIILSMFSATDAGAPSFDASFMHRCSTRKSVALASRQQRSGS